MKTKLGLILMVALFPMLTFAQENSRTQLKCYLQLEDQSDIIHHFVNKGENNTQFVHGLSERTVFMKDGVTEQKIATVYECVEIKARFQNKAARTLEKNTPF